MMHEGLPSYERMTDPTHLMRQAPMTIDEYLSELLRRMRQLTGMPEPLPIMADNTLKEVKVTKVTKGVKQDK